MPDLTKFKKKIKKSLIKINKDKKSLHDIDLSKNYVKDNFVFNYNKNILSDEAINRIFTFANYLKDKKKKFQNKDMWNNITSNDDHKNLMNYCINGDKDNFLKLILSSGKSKLVHGFLHYSSYEDLFSSDKVKHKESMQILDKLISLAEYKKLLKVFNPEQGGWIVENINYHKIIGETFLHEGKDIAPFSSPNFTFGINSNKKFYCLKDFKMFYTSLRLNELSKNYNLKEVHEIGAGLGFTAYYFNKINQNNYYIYDLPNILILQAYFLMSSIGEDKVSLSGENKTESCKINLHPFWEVFDNKESNNLLWVNQDSFPEIDLNLAKKYITKILQSKNSCLFSINQEARNDNSVGGFQHTVYDLLSFSQNFRSIYRSRDFLRLGYIEELYSINS